jgi:hypothetical protein
MQKQLDGRQHKMDHGASAIAIHCTSSNQQKYSSKNAVVLKKYKKSLIARCRAPQ